MNIVGIEVIRRNPGVATIEVPVGETLPVAVGDTVRVHMTVDHYGPAADGAIWTAIGWQTGVVIPEFIEAFNSRTPVHFNDDEDYVTYPIDCDVEITDISGFIIEFGLYGNVLDMYAKILEVPGPDIFTPTYSRVIEVEVEVPPQVELIQHTIYPYAYVYDGDVEVTTATFKTDPFSPTDWVAEKFAESVANEVEKEGGRVIELKVYVDKAPLLWTNFRIEVISTPIGGAAGVGIAVGIPIWAAILIAALAIAFLIAVITWSIKTITETLMHKPLSEEIKRAMSRETLITLANDFELKLERTPTPPEELEEKSDQELRDYCNQLAEEIIPREVSWLPLIIIGGLGLLGIGTAVVLATRR